MAQNTPNVTQQRQVLLVADRTLTPKGLSSLVQAHPRLQLLDLSADERIDTQPLPIERLRIDALLDLNRLHREFLDALDHWPRETLVDGQPFDHLFRHTTGDSLWWVGPGNQRHPFGGPLFPILRALFLVRAACARHQPSLLVVSTRDRRLATVLCSFCEREKQPYEFLPGSARRLERPGLMGRSLWTISTTVALVVLPLWILLRALFARLVTRPDRRSRSDTPALVMTGWYPNHVRVDESGRPHLWYWMRLTEALRKQHPVVAIRYLLHTTTFRFDGWKRWLRPFYTGWHRLRRLEGLLPLTQTNCCLSAYCRGAVRQWHSMRRYRRFESSPEFGRSFDFAGADCSCLLVGPLRNAVASIAKWSRNAAATAASLASAGNVRLVLVHEEFYPKGMLTIAAARSLGLQTMGVQHGAIGPQHTVYMLPPGNLTGAPVPNYFAAYGEYAVRTLSEVGAYPRDRIYVVGAPRFDELARFSADRSSVRVRLGWPRTGPVILLATETFALSEPVYRVMVEMARTHPHWHFAVKLHPHDRHPNAYREILSSAGASNVELCRDRLHERLAACDVLVTGYSTTAMEGLLMSKPVVCADFSTMPERYPLVESGAALSARRPDELAPAVERALRAPPDEALRQEFLRHHLGPTVDGAAAGSFASLIGEMFCTARSEARVHDKPTDQPRTA